MPSGIEIAPLLQRPYTTRRSTLTCLYGDLPLQAPPTTSPANPTHGRRCEDAPGVLGRLMASNQLATRCPFASSRVGSPSRSLRQTDLRTRPLHLPPVPLLRSRVIAPAMLQADRLRRGPYSGLPPFALETMAQLIRPWDGARTSHINIPEMRLAAPHRGSNHQQLNSPVHVSAVGMVTHSSCETDRSEKQPGWLLSSSFSASFARSYGEGAITAAR